MATSPNLTFTYLVEGQAGGEVTHNDTMNRIDGLCHLSVIAVQNAPPGSPSNGDVYRVDSAGTGAWSGHNGEIAMYYDGWVFQAPFEGMIYYLQSDNTIYAYDGAAWVAVPSKMIAVDADITDNSGGTPSSTIAALTDPADAPATADILRDDLVANLIPELRDAIASLAAEVNDLRAKMRTAGHLET